MPRSAQRAGAADVVLPEGVAAVDDACRRARAGGRARSIAASVASPAGSITQTARGACERRDELGKAARGRRALARQRPPRRRIAVMHDAGMPGPHQPPHNVAAHPAKTDDAELHGGPLGVSHHGLAQFAGDEREWARGVNGLRDPTRRVRRAHG